MPPLLFLILILIALLVLGIMVAQLTGESRMKFAELATQLHASAAQLNKAKAEIIAAVQKLTDAVANADNVPQDVADAAAEVQTATGALDDLNPDTPPDTPPAG